MKTVPYFLRRLVGDDGKSTELDFFGLHKHKYSVTSVL